MKKLYGLFAEYTNSFGQQLFVHKYKYCTAREIIKEKRILEETLLEMTLNNDENNLYIWFVISLGGSHGSHTHAWAEDNDTA